MGDFWSSRIFFLATWWAGYFFPFFSHKLSITFVLHAIFFFRQELAGNFFPKTPTPPPQSRVKWAAPYLRSKKINYNIPILRGPHESVDKTHSKCDQSNEKLANFFSAFCEFNGFLFTAS